MVGNNKINTFLNLSTERKKEKKNNPKTSYTTPGNP